MEHQLQKDKAQVAELCAVLARFERRYAMSSADFFSRYQTGQMGDDADVFEWNALYKMYVRLVDAIEAPDNQLQE